jgi:hypothetical protein
MGNLSRDLFDVYVTIHRAKFLMIKPTRCINFSNLFLEWNSTCFGQFICPSSGVFHCTQSNDSYRQPQTYVKPEAAIIFFELLMMSGVWPKTCRAIKKHWNNTFCYTVTSCWLFLYNQACISIFSKWLMKIYYLTRKDTIMINSVFSGRQNRDVLQMQ